MVARGVADRSHEPSRLARSVVSRSLRLAQVLSPPFDGDSAARAAARAAAVLQVMALVLFLSHLGRRRGVASLDAEWTARLATPQLRHMQTYSRGERAERRATYALSVAAASH